MPSNVLIDNTFNYDICEVYIAATNATDWGSNLLSTRLGDLEQAFFTYAGVGPYDVQVRECSDSGTNFAEWFEIYGDSGFAGP